MEVNPERELFNHQHLANTFAKVVAWERGVKDPTGIHAMAKARFDLKPGLATMWFPAAMVLLLLLRCPGILPLALNLLNLENTLSTAGCKNTSTSATTSPSRGGPALLLLLPPFLSCCSTSSS